MEVRVEGGREEKVESGWTGRKKGDWKVGRERLEEKNVYKKTAKHDLGEFRVFLKVLPKLNWTPSS